MQPSSGSTRPPDGANAPPAPQSAARRFRGRIWAAIAALGVLGSVGAYLTDLVLESAKDRLTEPIAVDVRDTTPSPNYLFAAAVRPEDAPVAHDSGQDAFREWAAAQQGIPYQDAGFELILRGRDPEPVVVQEIRVVVTDRSTAPADTWVNAWDGCGAAVPVRLLTVDLATQPPKVDLYVDGVPSNDAVFRITEAEVEVFDVEVSAGAGVISYVFEVHYSSAGRDGSIRVDDEGTPFRIAGGGAPAVFSTLRDPLALTPDEPVQEDLSRGGYLC